MDTNGLSSIARVNRQIRDHRLGMEDEAPEGTPDEVRANYVIAQIDDRCRREARAGRNHALIYGLTAEADYPPSADDYHRLGPGSLRGVARLVHAALSAVDLAPTIERWIDDESHGGFNLVAHWPLDSEGDSEGDSE